MHERKALMAELSDAFIALPGGFGTFDELCEMATWDQLGIHVKPLALVNIEGYFDGFLAQLDRAVEDRLVKPAHRTMLAVAATVDEALAAIAAWQAPDVPKWLQGGTPQALMPPLSPMPASARRAVAACWPTSTTPSPRTGG